MTPPPNALHPAIAQLIELAATEGYNGGEHSEILYALALPSGETLLSWEGNNHTGYRGNAAAYVIPATADLSHLIKAVREAGIEDLVITLSNDRTFQSYSVPWTGTIGVG